MKKTTLSLTIFAAVLGAAVLFAALFRGQPEETAPLEKLVATVNGEPVTVAFFNERYDRFAKRAYLPEAPSLPTFELKKSFLSRLIETRLLLQEAKTLGLSVSDAEIEDEISQITRDYPKDPFNLTPARSGLALEEWREELREKLLINKVIHREIDSVIHVSDEDVRAYYQEHKKEFELPMQVRARQIVVGTEEEAEALRKRILNGENFEDLAREYSLSPDAREGGDLGVFSKGQMPEEFDEVVFRYKPGNLSKVVASPYGFHIFRIEERIPPRTLSLEESSEEITSGIFQERREDFFREWFDSLKSEARITTYPENLGKDSP